ncbi:MAG TPA: YetF domain-containing protein [Cryptosporangiaceae bacterium]|nr:YetF domain-containing protein [Cryptosporangiaceae bacterium]
MWFDSWVQIWRIVAVGAAAYVTVVVVLRLSGKRTLGKLNAFDFVVTVAFGSTLATILLDSDVSWSEGAVALALLAILQLGVTWVSAWAPGGRSVINARPTLLLRDGKPLADALRRQRVTEGELRQAVRSTGTGSLADVAAVVLESDGTFSVIRTRHLGDGSTLTGVEGAR